MRSSQTLIPTLKETPADAEVISHQLMLRAGFIRKLAAGLYTWLPMGLKVLRKVENIVREEMNRAGAQEVLMPSVQPAELWQESGRWEQYGPELLRIKDRHQREFCYGPTHEEIITDLIRNDIHSYRQLPANFYQIQTKFRDEVRPRFGLMRGREFLMKDAYSFHVDQASLEETYRIMHATYCRIFDRLGLDYRPVEADTGSIGGSASHEFHVLADSGEDDIAFSNESDYAANVEMAEAVAPAHARAAASQSLTEVATPGQHSIEEVCAGLGVAASHTVKTLLVNGADENTIVALLVRGDHTLNEIKAEKHPLVANPLTMANETDIKQAAGCNAGSIGPVGLDVKVIADRSVAAMHDFVCGANKDGFHLTGVNWVRDLPEPVVADLRNVQNGDLSPDGKGTLQIRRGIEVGHIFQLGKKYSQALNASILDENGKSVIMTMGCYGIGVSRIVAAAIEQNNDDKGIIWPDSIAPVQVAIVPINAHKSEAVKKVAEDLYRALQEKGIEVLLDDRKERPGVMFADIELMGIPHRVTIGDKTLANNEVEYVNRRSMEKEALCVDGLAENIAARIKN